MHFRRKISYFEKSDNLLNIPESKQTKKKRLGDIFEVKYKLEKFIISKNHIFLVFVKILPTITLELRKIT